jgi:hypothetical protein
MMMTAGVAATIITLMEDNQSTRGTFTLAQMIAKKLARVRAAIPWCRLCL